MSRAWRSGRSGKGVGPHEVIDIAWKMAKKPLILVDNHITATSQIAEVVLPTAITGVESAGLAYRLDQIPIELSKIINPPNNLPSDEELLIQFYELLNQGGAE